MADDFYAEMQAMASEMLTEFNQAEYVLIRAGTPTPGANSWDDSTPGTPQTWTLQGITTAVDKKFVDGVTINVTDRQVLTASFADEPRLGDVLTINGQPQTILAVKPVTELGLAWKIIIKG